MYVYICMYVVLIYVLMYLMYEIICSSFVAALVITNGPMDTIVRTGSIANISCGFVNDSANFVPNWRIVRRSDDGTVISNITVSSSDIITNTNDGLEWVADTASGMFMSPNSRLLVGPVDETYSQSSYQCIFTFAGTMIVSSIGTLIVVGEYKYYTDIHTCRYVYHIVSNYSQSCINIWYHLVAGDGVHCNKKKHWVLNSIRVLSIHLVQLYFLTIWLNVTHY